MRHTDDTAAGRGGVMSESTTDTGWGWPLNSRKAHYFTADNRSLCGGWFFLGPLSDDNHDSPDNCKRRVGARERSANRRRSRHDRRDMALRRARHRNAKPLA